MSNKSPFFLVGQEKRVSHTLTGTSSIVVSEARVVVFDSAGTQVFADTAEYSVPGTAVRVYFIWGPVAAGFYSYTLYYTIDDEESAIQGYIDVWPESGSKFDPYIRDVVDWLSNADITISSHELSKRQYVLALQESVEEYQKVAPRLISKNLALNASDWVYPLTDLSTGINPVATWLNGFSSIQEIQYPYDISLQGRVYLDLESFKVDEQNSTLYLLYNSPSAGQTAQILWSTAHTLSHTVDTLPVAVRSSITEYAAGVALATMLANKASLTNEPAQGADLISYRDMQTRRLQQGEKLMKRARMRWVPEQELSL